MRSNSHFNNCNWHHKLKFLVWVLYMAPYPALRVSSLNDVPNAADNNVEVVHYFARH